MKPTQPNERHDILDVVRGFALCGDLIANMASHSGFYFLDEASVASLPLSDLNQVTFWIIHFLTDGKFYSIFSLLFGIGFGLQIQRAAARDQRFGSLFSRRLGLLFLFGLLHAILFYVGDILTVYALLGFVLLLFRNTSNKNLVRWAIVLLILPVIQYFIMWWPMQATVPLETGRQAMFDQLIMAYQSGSIGDILTTNIFGLAFGRYPDLIFTGRFFKVLAMFLLGSYVARQGLFKDLEGNRPLFKKILFWGVIIGIPCNVALATLYETDWYYTFDPLGILEPMVYAYGVPALGLAYAAALALLYPSGRFHKILSVFGPFGRMALTNYLAQSVIACLIFMSYGLGLFGKVGVVVFTAIGIGILIIQILISNWWLKRFLYGPMEWLWRSMTYRKWQPIRRPETPSIPAAETR